MIIFIPLGIIASIFQLVLLREFSFSAAKHELILVISAGAWIIFCALGSILKLSKNPRKLNFPVLTCLLFSFSACLIHLAKSMAGLKYYQAASLGILVLLSLILIGPVAFIIGLGFKQFTQEYAEENPLPIDSCAKIFAFEAIGFFLGGAAFTFIFKDYTNPLIFSLLSLTLLPAIKNSRQKIFSAALIIIIALVSIENFNLIIKKEFSGAEILMNRGSRYGPIIATRKSDLITLFSGGSLLATNQDKPLTEEFIHMSLSAGEPKSSRDVLFIGPAVSGQVTEIAKYKLNSLDCLQIDPLILEFIPKPSTEGLKNKVKFITEDPRAYLRKTDKQYDVILMNMPPPANLALNRYFTEEFFRLVSKRLKPQGTFSFRIPSKREILSPQFSRFDSSIINALDKVFTNRLIIPSDSMIIIASKEKEIRSRTLLENFSRAKPKTEFFTIYHFKDYLNPAMLDYTESMLDKNMPANTDLNPSGFLNYLILEQTKFYPDLKVDFKKDRFILEIFLLFLILLIIPLSGLSQKASCLLNIGAIGFTSISLSSIIFILFQLYCAALFWKLGLLIGMFMAGISLGIYFIGKIKSTGNRLLRIYLCWLILIFVLFSNLKAIGGSNYTQIIFYCFSLFCGFLTGNAYPILAQDLLINKFKTQNIVITLYAADLAGAFLGTLVSGIVLIPFLGIPESLLVLISLNAVFALKNLRR